jgi:hypothetical protein
MTHMDALHVPKECLPTRVMRPYVLSVLKDTTQVCWAQPDVHLVQLEALITLTLMDARNVRAASIQH